MIARGNLPTGLGDEPKAVMSLIPATYFREIRDIDFDRENALMPARPNGQLEAIEMVEGVLMNSLPADQGAMRSLAITYRGGRIDTAWTVGRVVNDLRKEEVRLVWPKNFDDALLDGVLSGAARLHPHRITGPWFVHVTLLDIGGYSLVLNDRQVSAPAWRDQLTLPSFRADMLNRAALLPLMRAFWLAFGVRRPEQQAYDG